MHLRVFLSHLSALASGPNHEGVHWPLDAVTFLLAGCLIVVAATVEVGVSVVVACVGVMASGRRVLSFGVVGVVGVVRVGSG